MEIPLIDHLVRERAERDAIVNKIRAISKLPPIELTKLKVETPAEKEKQNDAAQ